MSCSLDGGVIINPNHKAADASGHGDAPESVHQKIIQTNSNLTKCPDEGPSFFYLTRPVWHAMASLDPWGPRGNFVKCPC